MNKINRTIIKGLKRTTYKYLIKNRSIMTDEITDIPEIQEKLITSESVGEITILPYDFLFNDADFYKEHFNLNRPNAKIQFEHDGKLETLNVCGVRIEDDSKIIITNRIIEKEIQCDNEEIMLKEYNEELEIYWNKFKENYEFESEKLELINVLSNIGMSKESIIKIFKNNKRKDQDVTDMRVKYYELKEELDILKNN